MIRRVIEIDREKCNGCGLCARACHESAIGMVNGKVQLLRDDYCDGLGDCLPACPTGAISFVEREAADYDEAAVFRNKRSKQQWPVQIKLTGVNAPYFEDADLLIAADCTAYAYARFQEEFRNGKVVLIGCPKLDAVDYTGKLAEIIEKNSIRSITVVRMEVPCCGGMERAVKKALESSGKTLPLEVVTISVQGERL